MKSSINQIALTAVLLVTLGVSNSFANPKNGEIKTSFEKDFKHAEVMSTDASDAYTKITFKINGAIMFAFYNENGELLAVTHNIRSTELPINLMLQVKRNYANYWVSDLFEMDANGTTNYYITLENAGTKLTLRSNAGSWETYSKITKE